MKGMKIRVIKVREHSLFYVILQGTTLLKGMMDRISHPY